MISSKRDRREARMEQYEVAHSTNTKAVLHDEDSSLTVNQSKAWIEQDDSDCLRGSHLINESLAALIDIYSILIG